MFKKEKKEKKILRIKPKKGEGGRNPMANYFFCRF